jgi:dipeptidyl aminopeptidase/acylaminoacyl peptidase
MNGDGSGQVRLTSSPVNETEPAWSPDGARIVFRGLNDATGQLVVMNANGSAPTPLTANADINAAPAWSPDGARIAWRHFAGGTGISLMGAAGGGAVQIVPDASRPDWFPDGSRLVFDRSVGDEVWSAAPDGSGLVQLADAPGAADAEPAVSPDGRRIAFSSFRDGNFELYVMNADGSVEIRDTLTAAGVHDTGPDWQPIAPVPLVTGLSRPVAGSPGATLTVDGTGFVLRSVVRWNGADRPTAFAGGGRLTAQLTAADVAAPGTAQVTVFTSPAGGGLSVAQTATIDPPPPAPRLAVTSVTVRSRWARSRVRGTVRVRGTAERAGRVEVALLARHGRAARVVARRRATLGPGAFRTAVNLPRTLLPGRLTVRLREVGPVAGAPLTEAARSAVLRPPREGVVRTAFVSALQGGPPVRRLRAGRRLFAHFRFAAQPRRGLPLTAAWTRGGRRAGVAVRKPHGRPVIAFIGKPGGRLPAGSYRCTLRAGSRVVAVARVRVV